MDRPVLELIHERFSCRTYRPEPIAESLQARLREQLESARTGPLGSPVRLILTAAAAGDARALKGLVTYGTIRDPQGFIIGVTGPGARNLEDLGYVLERAILWATANGLGTCWLGGFFRRSRFAEKAGLAAGEAIPAVISVGYCADASRSGGMFGRIAKRSSRLPAVRLFFSGSLDRPLADGEAGLLSSALEAVRWAPSASNKQPWRLVRQGSRWHFYLRRTRGYGTGLQSRLLGQADLQRVDTGIAMCHFELAAREAGATGAWELADPGMDLPDDLTSYAVTWRETEPRSKTEG